MFWTCSILPQCYVSPDRAAVPVLCRHLQGLGRGWRDTCPWTYLSYGSQKGNAEYSWRSAHARTIQIWLWSITTVLCNGAVSSEGKVQGYRTVHWLDFGRVLSSRNHQFSLLIHVHSKKCQRWHRQGDFIQRIHDDNFLLQPPAGLCIVLCIPYGFFNFGCHLAHLPGQFLMACSTYAWLNL